MQGLYCHICGQANVETNETLWDLIQHFVYDITHFDGKFFSTLRLLLFKPGFLSKEYMRGRRMSYLNPVRMYIFTSALFFLIIFATQKPESALEVDKDVAGVSVQRELLKEKLKAGAGPEFLKPYADSLQKLDTVQLYYEALKLIPEDRSIPDSVRRKLMPYVEDSIRKTQGVNFDFGRKLPFTVEEYKAEQAKLSKREQDGFFKRYLNEKLIRLNEKYRFKPGEMFKAVSEKFVHSLPKMMFLSLPFVAGLLMLLYRRQKKYYYVSHGIHAVHVYIAMYIFILIIIGLNALKDATGWAFWQWLATGIILYTIYYNYKSLRNFYEQSRGKTMVKFMLMLFATIFLFILLTIGFVINSMLQV